jgi:eukaryotic-like serine/threonine-protein kinase
VSLLTIVFTDVVGSSATKRDLSLGRDNRERDRAYLEKVQTRHFSLIRECYRAHGGREVSTMGDAFYLTFDDPVEALRCAVRVQKQLTAEPIDTPLGPLRIRIGIHSGFPESFEGSWHGTDVDTAARVESVAAGQQILVSARTYELVQHMTDLKFHSCGEFALKGVGQMGLWEADWDGKGPRTTAAPPLRMQARQKRMRLALAAAIAAVLALASFGFRVYTIRKARQMAGLPASATARRSIAVLGFKNLGKPEGDWISNALSEFFTSELAANGLVRTIPGENVAHAKIDLSLPDADSYGADTLTRIRKLLGADDVILGSYLELGSQAGGQIRVDLRVQDTLACETVCSVSEIGAEGNLFELVAKAGANLRQHLGIGEISKEQEASARAALPSNSDAVRLYAEGRKKLERFDALGARADLEKAVAAEPGFALAHSALSAAWAQLGYNQKSREEARRANELSSGLSREDQLSIRGRYEAAISDWSKAIETYRTLWNFFPDNLEYGLQLANTQIRADSGQEALATISNLRKLEAPHDEDVRIDLAESGAAERLSDFSRQRVAAERAAARAKASGARLLEARALIGEGRAFRELGQPENAVEAYRQSSRIATSVGDRATEAYALSDTAIVLSDQSNYGEAEKMLREAISIRGEIGNKVGVGQSLVEMASLRRHQGANQEAQRLLKEALGYFREAGEKVNAAMVQGNLANLLADQGDLAGAMREYEEAIKVFHEAGNKKFEAILLSNIGLIQLRQGNLAGARGHLDQALKIDRELGNKNHTPDALLNLGEVFQAEGDLAEARHKFSEALDIASSGGQKALAATALRSLGDISVEENHLEAARQQYEQALSIRTEAGEKADIAQVRLALANLSVEDGHSKDVVGPIRDTRKEFRKVKSCEDEIAATTLLIEALLLRELTSADIEAQKEIESTQAVAAKCQNLGLRLEFNVASARVKAASKKVDDRAGAARDLNSSLAEATRTGFLIIQLRARLALGELEVQSSDLQTGRARLAAVEKDAAAKGFLLIARKAKAMAGRS